MTSRLVDLVAAARVLMLDFDGPVCALFAGYPAPVMAEELCALAADRGATVTSDSPLQVLREVAALDNPALTQAVADAAGDAEVIAAATARPTAGVDAVLRAARGTGRRVAIVSNNAAEAVHAYLNRHALDEHVDLVVGRYDGMDPRQLKPDDHLVRLALRSLAVAPEAALFVGDSTTDIEAGHAAAVPTIGYANKPGKRERLSAAGADAVIDSMAELVDAMHASADRA
ncbi:HAD family hydrolase [Dactylosporangium sucinum]|uniref:Hydrolase n=1 Tax=Dactylosporangium sucinum TaxID=1424081 RepID=A0A917U2R3_9ACTN|nr:HAD hydrolase-like protein [Dactylosporangium sucinum]GGM51023.1 hydrolase [Dactylosporangium sucinum]